MTKSNIRLISVTEHKWGPDCPGSLSAMKNNLLPLKGKDCPYDFTGKQRPILQENDILVFRFEGKLLGEGKFLKWDKRKPNRMIYKPIRQYKERVLSYDFIKTGRSIYPSISRRKILLIRKSALRMNSGPYLKTGEKESIATHRIGQGKVRESALDRYGKRCSLCPIDEPGLLVAGHIRGWAKGKKARGNPENVILMCAFHDSLFGKGFIRLTPGTYNLIISKEKISEATYRQIKKCSSKFREPTNYPPAKEHLLWHKSNIFER